MITSLSNDKIIAMRKLVNLKERKSTGLFLAEGLRVVAQAFDSSAAIEQVIYCPALLVSEFGLSLVEKAHLKSIPLLEVSEGVFASLARKETPQGIAAVIQQQWDTLFQVSPQPGDLWVGLQAIQNPGNLGTILRTCDAAGAQGVVLLDDCTDPYDPAAVKASMGSIFTVRLIKSGFGQFKPWLDLQNSFAMIGSSDKASQDCFLATYPDTCLLLMGSERQGLPPEYLALCHQVVRIPMEGACDSLNLSVATGIILYQIYNQHRTIAQGP
ncbi:MAG: RNA methyltransferase [Anaerolineaceae bacterium]